MLNKHCTFYQHTYVLATQGPEGGQEWREVRRGGDPGTGDYSLEQEVQHMIGGMDSTESQQQQSAVQQQQYGSVNQHNLTTYKVKSRGQCPAHNNDNLIRFSQTNTERVERDC